MGARGPHRGGLAIPGKARGRTVGREDVTVQGRPPAGLGPVRAGVASPSVGVEAGAALITDGARCDGVVPRGDLTIPAVADQPLGKTGGVGEPVGGLDLGTVDGPSRLERAVLTPDRVA